MTAHSKKFIHKCWVILLTDRRTN